jgi:TonB family protein
MRRVLGVSAALLITAAVAVADVQVSRSDALKAAVVKPQPAYSPIARQMKVSGRVEVEVLINEQGAVETARVLTGNPLLTQSAIIAVEKWKFTPFTSDGKAVRATTTIVFEFQP